MYSISLKRLVMVAVCLGAPVLLCAQVYYSTLVGTVRDASGAIVPHARVVATELSTNINFETHTTGSGDYAIQNLRPGRYRLEIDASGFKRKEVNDITIVVAQATRVDASLEVGASTQVVQVSGVAPLVQSESGERGGVMQGAEVEALPLLTRDFMNLTLEFPGAVTSESSNMGPANEPGVRVNGHSEFGNTAVVDGGFVMGQLQMTPVEFLNIDSIQEMKVETANYSAENGGHAGAVITVATKHGTNQIHGDVFEFVQNDKFNAANFFATTLPKAPVRYNLFGGTVGGPIKKDRLFFFGSYQGVRNISPQNFLSEVPTAAERQGNFAADPPVYNPVNVDPVTGNRIQYTGNQIPQSQWNAISQKYLPFWPAPNVSGTPNFTYNGASKNNYNLFSGRVDWNVSSRDTIYGRYSHQSNPTLTPGSLPGPGNYYQGSTKGGSDMVVSWIHTFSGAKFNQARFSFANAYRTSLQGGFASANEASVLGYAFASNLVGLSTGCPYVGMSGYGSTQIAPVCEADDNYNAPNRTYYVVDDYTFIHGAHTFKTGFLWMNYRDNGNSGRPGGGVFSFSGLYTASTGDTSGQTGYPFADFLLGAQNSLSYSQGFFKTNDTKMHYQGYFEDSWKVTSRLNLDLGLRYEINRPETSDGTLPAWVNGVGQVGFPQQRTGLVYVFPANAKANVTTALNGQPFGVPYTFSNTNALAYAHWRNIAPRVGFAYRLFGSPRTVIRGGYGFFYDYENFNGIQAGDARPFLGAASTPPQTVSPENQMPPYYLGQSPGPPINYLGPGTLIPMGEQADPQSEQDSRTQQWNLTFQRGFGSGWSIEAGYVGNRADHLMIDQFANRFYPVGFTFNYTNGASFTIQNSTPLLDRVPWPEAQQGFIQTPYGKADYEAVQFSVVKQMSRGLEMRAGYTRQRARSDTDEGFRSNFSFITVSEFDQAMEPTNADIPNVFYMTFVYQLPGQHLHGFAGAALGGWQTAGNIQLQTGQRSDLRELYPQWQGATGGFVDPVITCEPNISASQRTLQRWFNTNCVQQPGLNQFGNDSATNRIVDDSMRNLNISLVKYFHTFENQRLQFRAEFFNAFNHPLFGAPDGVRGDPGFATVTYAGAPRQIQFALKYEF